MNNDQVDRWISISGAQFVIAIYNDVRFLEL